MNPDDLYGVPLDRFIAARNELAKQTDDSEEAKRIRSLRKPTLAAWAVNQVARAAPADVRSLVDLGDELRAASADDLRALGRRRNRLVAALVERARDLLVAAGHADSASTAERITKTLQAASTDPGAVDDLVAGRLETDLEPTGFTTFSVVVDEGRAADETTRRRKRSGVESLRAAALAAEREADRLENEAETAEHLAQAARRAARTGRRRADAARAKLAKAEADLES